MKGKDSHIQVSTTHLELSFLWSGCEAFGVASAGVKFCCPLLTLEIGNEGVRV